VCSKFHARLHQNSNTKECCSGAQAKIESNKTRSEFSLSACEVCQKIFLLSLYINSLLKLPAECPTYVSNAPLPQFVSRTAKPDCRTSASAMKFLRPEAPREQNQTPLNRLTVSLFDHQKNFSQIPSPCVCSDRSYARLRTEIKFSDPCAAAQTRISLPAHGAGNFLISAVHTHICTWLPALS
jgi:hypothetical protein